MRKLRLYIKFCILLPAVTNNIEKGTKLVSISTSNKFSTME